MRKLEFRVWNGREMIYDVVVGKFGVFYVNPENGDGLNPDDTASLSQNTTKYHENNPVMQFTGLPDKNGTEIYEGDILQFGNRAIQEVKFENGCFSVFGEPLGWDFDNIEDGIRVPIKCDLRFCEIIGNIYEHNHLLK